MAPLPTPSAVAATSAPNPEGDHLKTANNPTALSDYDWMEFYGFAHKVEWEGYDYAVANYPPRFEDPALQEQSTDPARLSALYKEHVDKIDEWAQNVGWDHVHQLWSAHQREEKERRERHLPWALHPGGDWDYAAYLYAFESREAALQSVANSDRLAAQRPDSHPRRDWRLLHREASGGAWTQVSFERTT